MARIDIDKRFEAVDLLVKQMNFFAPSNNIPAIEFRADLGRLLTVSIVSAYEASVQTTLVEYAMRQHPNFGYYIETYHEKLNAKININDLNRMAKTYSPTINDAFNFKLAKARKHFKILAHKDLNNVYKQLIKWRHRSAHSIVNSTTIEEAMEHHRVAKHVIYIFDQVFSEA